MDRELNKMKTFKLNKINKKCYWGVEYATVGQGASVSALPYVMLTLSVSH